MINHIDTAGSSAAGARDSDYLSELQNNVLRLFPSAYGVSPVPELCRTAFNTMAELMPEGDLPRVPGWAGPDAYARILDRFGHLPPGPVSDAVPLMREMAAELLAGTTVWRSKDLQYNVGTAPNAAASAIYALALDLNVILISDGQAGHAVLAERAVSDILAEVSNVSRERARGLFTFGGTGTIVYAIKSGIRRCAPESAVTGVPGDVCVMVTADAHFSHATAADWLGLGAEQVVVVPVDVHDRRTDLKAAERLLRQRLDGGARIATMLINGGTTYDHTVDDIAGFAELRDRLVSAYSLDYVPHLHVDSVIGWSWLFFSGSESFGADIDAHPDTVQLLRRQYERICDIRLADSWGVDFHKGIGGCPAECSLIQFNDKTDLARLRKGGGSIALHQLAEEFSDLSPVDYTLETTRSGGKALAALMALHSVGRRGYQRLLVQLMDAATNFRRELSRRDDVVILNEHALGFQTMVRLQPPGTGRLTAADELHGSGQEVADIVRAGNAYLKAFFAWDNRERMNVNGGGVVYSFSAKYVTTASGEAISGLKFYPTSPHTGADDINSAVDLLMSRKSTYDRSIR